MTMPIILDFLFLGSSIYQEIKRNRDWEQLEKILKCKDLSEATKGQDDSCHNSPHYYEFEGCSMKTVDWKKFDSFEIRCWRRVLQILQATKKGFRPNQPRIHPRD